MTFINIAFGKWQCENCKDITEHIGDAPRQCLKCETGTIEKHHASKCCRGGGHAPMRCHCLCDCDGYHTFGELYEHRIALYIALCKRQSKSQVQGWWSQVWRSKAHSDGTTYDGWFILGIAKAKGYQITYHLPMSEWENTEFAETLETAPEWDKHTSADVLERIKTL